MEKLFNVLKPQNVKLCHWLSLCKWSPREQLKNSEMFSSCLKNFLVIDSRLLPEISFIPILIIENSIHFFFQKNLIWTQKKKWIDILIN